MTSATFVDYNLRGLIVTYLEEQGWFWSAENESWTREDVVFSGPYATANAMQEQIEREEGRLP